MYCSMCGAKLLDGTQYCSSCGAYVKTEYMKNDYSSQNAKAYSAMSYPGGKTSKKPRNPGLIIAIISAAAVLFVAGIVAIIALKGTNSKDHKKGGDDNGNGDGTSFVYTSVDNTENLIEKKSLKDFSVDSSTGISFVNDTIIVTFSPIAKDEEINEILSGYATDIKGQSDEKKQVQIYVGKQDYDSIAEICNKLCENDLVEGAFIYQKDENEIITTVSDNLMDQKLYYDSLYDDIIAQYRNDMLSGKYDGLKEFGYDIQPFYYSFCDANGDGIDEMIISAYNLSFSSSCTDSYIMYTLIDGKPEKVDFSIAQPEFGGEICQNITISKDNLICVESVANVNTASEFFEYDYHFFKMNSDGRVEEQFSFTQEGMSYVDGGLTCYYNENGNSTVVSSDNWIQSVNDHLKGENNKEFQFYDMLTGERLIYTDIESLMFEIYRNADEITPEGLVFNHDPSQEKHDEGSVVKLAYDRCKLDEEGLQYQKVYKAFYRISDTYALLYVDYYRDGKKLDSEIINVHLENGQGQYTRDEKKGKCIIYSSGVLKTDNYTGIKKYGDEVFMTEDEKILSVTRAYSYAELLNLESGGIMSYDGYSLQKNAEGNYDVISSSDGGVKGSVTEAEYNDFMNKIKALSAEEVLFNSFKGSVVADTRYTSGSALSEGYPAATYFVSATASSFLGEQTGKDGMHHTYIPENVLYDNDACWTEGASDFGTQEWIELKLPETQMLKGLVIKNGYNGTEWQYSHNSKVSSCRLEFSDGQTIEKTLTVYPTSERDTAQYIIFDTPVVTDSVKLIITGVDAGDISDTCISYIAPY